MAYIKFHSCLILLQAIPAGIPRFFAALQLFLEPDSVQAYFGLASNSFLSQLSAFIRVPSGFVFKSFPWLGGFHHIAARAISLAVIRKRFFLPNPLQILHLFQPESQFVPAG